MKPVGILGGGQLARMMVLKAHELGLKAQVLSENADDPAAQVTASWIKGRLDNKSQIEKFLQSCSVVTFESEFLDAAQLELLSRKTKTPVFPPPLVMARIQDRLTQKQLLDEYQIPTARWLVVGNAEDARAAFEIFAGRVVFKKRRFGYDGYGTFVVTNERQLTKFLGAMTSCPDGFIGEELIAFERELAVILVRGQDGEQQVLPVVETHQEDSRCLWVKGPLPRLNRQLRPVVQKMQRALNSTNYVGVMAIELFSVGSEFFVNELAPRVHNSGHYSLDALTVDQFSLHLKTLIREPLGQPQLRAPGFAMYNLLGDSARTPRWTLPTDCVLHWYGKSKNRPGRKMGHLTALAASPEKALKLLQKRRNGFQL